MIVVPSLECGGLERNISILCNHINTDRFEVTLVVIDNQRPFYSITNVNIHQINLQCNRVLKAIRPLLNLIKKEKPQIVLSAANHLNLLLAISKRFFPAGTKLLARESSLVSVNSKRAKMAPLYNLLQKLFYTNVNLVICQSKAMQNDLIRFYGFPVSKTCIIRNPVSQPKYNLMAQDKIGKANFLTVARLSPEKGIDRIIRALEQVSLPFHYTIVGEGLARNDLELLIKSLQLQDRVTLTGSLVNPFYHEEKMDLFLMGSHYEGFPNALIEANSIGIPVIAFNAPGGISEALQEKQLGWLVPDGDIPAYAMAIENALQHPPNSEWIRETTLKKYDPYKVIAEWENLLLQQVSR